MSDPTPPTSQWETFLRTTKRRVSRPANDHDRAVNGAGRTALLDQVDILKALEKRVRKAVRSRVEILSSEERELRVLSKSKTKEVVRECEVLIDARQGGVLLVRDIETKVIVSGPRPLNAREREVFASTKSQPGLFGDAVGVNEELAKKLNLMEYLADDAPMSMEERITHALAAGDLPADVKEAILRLDETDDEPASEKKPKAVKEPGSKRGRKKKGAEPAVNEPPPPPTAAPNEQPGPAKAEKDDELPKAPPVKRAAEPPAAPASELAVTGEATFGAVAFRYRDLTPSTPNEGGYEVAITLHRSDNTPESLAMLLAACEAEAAEPLVVPTLGAPVWMKAKEWSRDADPAHSSEEVAIRFVQMSEEVVEDVAAAPGNEPSAEAGEDDALEGLPETTDEAAFEEGEAPEAEEAHEAPTYEAPAEDGWEPQEAPVETQEEGAVEEAAEPVEEEAPEPVEPTVAAEEPTPEPETPARPEPAPVEKSEKKGRGKKKDEPAPAASPAVSVDNHFGLSAKLAEQASAGIERAVARTVYFESTAVAQTEKASGMKLTPTMSAALVPILRHLAATGKLTRREVGTDAAYYRLHEAPKPNELTEALVESAIAAHTAK